MEIAVAPSVSVRTSASASVMPASSSAGRFATSSMWLTSTPSSVRASPSPSSSGPTRMTFILLVLDGGGRFVGHVVDHPRDVVVLARDATLDALERLPVDFLRSGGHAVSALDRPDRDHVAVDAVVPLDAGRLAEDRGERLPRVVLLEFLLDDVGRLAGDFQLLLGDRPENADRQPRPGERH